MPLFAINSPVYSASGVHLDSTPDWTSTQFWGPPQISYWTWMMSQQGGNNQPNSYYPQAHFPSPSMSGQYSYPPPEGQANSPSGANMASQPSLSLPPIRVIDGQPQQQHQQRPGQSGAQPQTGSAMPLGMAQYYPQGQPFPPASDPNAPMRYPIPPDGRVMSGGRHKKEIKRRTKTGCLTCRKRRIKCDEAHPACRNCQKSKRECLGYDPIFKSQPGPSNIQPALGGAPQPTSSNSSPYPPPPQGYIPADGQGYGQARTDSDNSPAQPYDYTAAIDPALEGGASQMDSTSALGTGTPYPIGGPDQHSHRAKRTKIEELLCLRGVNPPPPAPPTVIPEETRNEIKDIFLTVYAIQIDKFLETRWFAHRAVNYLVANSRLCDQFVTLIRRYNPNTADPNYWNVVMITQSLEATVIWAMMGMCRQVSSSAKSDEGDEKERENLEKDVKEGVHDAAKRLEIFENLITGEYLDSDSAPQPTPQQPGEGSNGVPFNAQLLEREHDFWRLVHKFLTIRDDEASAAKEIDDTLASARNLLDSRENRDVIYSICIARHVGARMAEFPAMQQPQSNDEEESRNKLFIAQKFVNDEAAGKGTNQVVQRLCGMASRSWEFNRPVMPR